MALLLMLERLTPDERTVFLLHDVFGHKHHDIASILGKVEPICRQLLHRARMSIRVGRPRFNVNDDQFKSLVPRFLDAFRSDDHTSLMMLMSEDAPLISDSGGRVRATLKTIQGNDRIARLLMGLRRKQTGKTIEKLMLVNLDLGIVTYVDECPVAVFWFEIERWKITRVYRLLNPDKLRRVPSLPIGRRSPSVALTGWAAIKWKVPEMSERNLRSCRIRNAEPSDLAVVRQISADAYIAAYVPKLG